MLASGEHGVDFCKDAAMKLLTLRHRPFKPRRAYHRMAAYLAYFTTVCASMAAAAAVATDTVPLLVVGV